MDEQLDFAPCGFVSLAIDGTIQSINHTLLSLLDCKMDEVKGKHIHTILAKPSQAFYQLYIFPLLKVQEKVEEMFLTLKSNSSTEIPVLFNAHYMNRNGKMEINCIIFPMKKRYEYEQLILAAKKMAEESNRCKTKAISDLEQVQKELKSKQKELLEINQTLKRLAITDELTGLNNRRSYKKALSQNLSLYKRTTNPFSLLMIDIDYFKKINDTYGHLIGDQILKELARILVDELREQDISFRYGGEEFAVILPNTNINDSIFIAEKVRRSVEYAEWQVPSVTISIGIATTKIGDTIKTIQTRADKALYESKNNGRNQITHAYYSNCEHR